MKKKALLLFFILSLTACASAARILYPVSEDPLKIIPGSYTLDPTHANIIFSVNHLGFSLHHGRFNTISGSLVLDTARPEAAKLFVKTETDSIDTNSVELDRQLKGKRMFDTSNFPAASFESQTIQITGEKSALIEGMLTLKGIKKPVAIEATFIGSGTNPTTGKKTIGFKGAAKFNRSDFGLKEWLPLVGDEINLILEAEFTRTRS